VPAGPDLSLDLTKQQQGPVGAGVPTAGPDLSLNLTTPQVTPAAGPISPAIGTPIGGFGAGIGTALPGGLGLPPTGLNVVASAARAHPGGLTGLVEDATNALGLGNAAHVASNWLSQNVADPAIHYGIQQPWNDVQQMITQAPIGAVRLAEGLATHPIGTAEQFARAAIAPLEDPGKDPFMTALTIASFLPTPFAIAGRGLEAARVLGGTSDWATAIARGAARMAEFQRGLEPTVPLADARAAAYAAGEAADRAAAGGAAQYLGRTDIPGVVGQLTTPALESGPGWSPLAGAAGRAAGEASAREQLRNLAETGRAEPLAAAAGPPSRILTTGEQLWRALVFGQPQEERLLTAARYQAPGYYYSRNPLIRTIQKQIDAIHEEHPDYRFPVPGVWASQQARIGRANLSTQTFWRNYALRDVIGLKKFFKSPDSWHEAVGLIGRGMTPERQAAFIREQVLPAVQGHRFQTARANTWLKATEDAAQFLTTHEVTVPHRFDAAGDLIEEGGTHTLPLLREDAPQELKDYLEKARTLSNGRTQALIFGKVLDPMRAALRTLAPKNIMEGHGLNPDVGAMNDRLANLTAQGFGDSRVANELRANIRYWTERPEGVGPPTMPLNSALAEHLFRVPEGLPNRTVGDFIRRPFSGAKPQLPSTLTNAYHGAILRFGGPERNTARLIAESYAESTKFLYLNRLRKMAVASAATTPRDIPVGFRLPILLDRWKGRLPAGNEFLQNLLREGDAAPTEAEAAGWRMNNARSLLMDPRAALDWVKNWTTKDDGGLRWAKQHGFPQDATLADLERYEIPNVGWIDKRLLGGIDRPPPAWQMSESTLARGLLQAQDAINEAMKAMILYLKPAYIVPNFLGNVAMALVQQGFMTPMNLVNVYRLLFSGKGLPEDVVNTYKAVSGGGFAAETLSDSAKTVFTRMRGAINWAAGQYAKVVDDPLRLASIIHEANAAGFSTREDLIALARDPRYERSLMEVSNRANDALINYARLTPGEQEYLKRIIFFYPWVKGSTRYGYQLAINHPTVALAQAPAARIGQQWQGSVLGPLPDWAQGFIPFGRNQVMNPGAAALLQTPGNLMDAIANIVRLNPNPTVSLLANLAPVEAGIYAGLSGHTPLGAPARESWLQRGVSTTFEGIPAINDIVQALSQPNPASYYPTRGGDPWNAFSRWALLGGITPTVWNIQKANINAWREAHPTGWQR
jgi:hypothetical protein